MGVVFRARDHTTGQDVALKVILQAQSETSLKRFQREGELTAALRHPGIVGIHSCGFFQGKPYLAYELVEGQSFEERMEGLDLCARVEVLRDAAVALGFAHSKGVVHRDVKAANILVDEQGRGRVADFGLATAGDLERLTQTGAFLGTPSHISPEQIGGEQVGPASDVWSLGVVLYQALTDELPFVASTPVELIGQIIAGELSSPRSLAPDIPRALEAICLRALERKPERRYSDGAALADALQGYLDAPDAVASRRGRWAWIAAACLAAGALLSWSLTVGGDPVEQTGQHMPESPESPAAPPVRRLSQAKILEGRRTLDGLVGVDPRLRHKKITLWLADYPGHPDQARAREVLRRAQLEFEILTLVHEVDDEERVVPQLVRGQFLTDDLVLTQGNAMLRCWSLSSPRELLWELSSGPAQWVDVGVSPDRSQLVISQGSNPPKGFLVVDVATLETEPLGGGVPTAAFGRQLAFSPDGALLAASTSKAVYLLTWPARKPVRVLETPHVRDMAFTSDARYLVLGAGAWTPSFSLSAPEVRGATLEVYEVATGRRIARTRAIAPTGALRISADDSYAVVGDELGNLFRIRLPGLEDRVQFKPRSGPKSTFDAVSAHAGAIRGLGFTSDGRFVFSINNVPGKMARKKEIAVWTWPEGREIRRIDRPHSLFGISVSPDRTRFLVGSRGGMVELYAAQGE